MCRDKGYTATKLEHIHRFSLEDIDYYYSSYHTLAGTAGDPVVMYDGVAMRNTSLDGVWGIMPPWSKTVDDAIKNANRAVNARVETIEESRLFKPLFERGQRCLVPCTHYFEHHWLDSKKKTSKKIPFAVRKKGDQIFTTPGLYATWTDKESGEVVLSYTMFTTAANALMAKVHNAGDHGHRMPLVIERDMEAIWLKPDATYKELKEVMDYKIPANHLEAWPVHTIRGKNARTGPDVLEEWTEYSSLLE